jgi:multidrug resistance efflux pump
MRITVRNLRIVTAIGLAGAAIWAISPYATNYVSSQAVVNAPLNTVLSPMQGHITQRSPPAGTVVVSGTPLVAVNIEERDRRYREQLRARLMQLDESLASIDAETSKLAVMEKVMTARIRSYGERVLARLTAEAREAEAAMEAAEARRENAEATLRRARVLVRQGYATDMRVDADIAARTETVAEVSRTRARLERVQIEAAAAKAGIFVQNGWNDVPYSQQRLDGIVLKLASLATERRRLASERAALDGQIAVEELLITKRETFSLVAPSAGVVWRESGAVGETVVPGDVLVQMVNCEARFVEVTLAERHFGSISPGDTARVRLTRR